MGMMSVPMVGDVGAIPSPGGPSQARPDLGPNVGAGVGLPSPDNPIYGQNSPFQPPTPTPTPDTGTMGFGKGMGDIGNFINMFPPQLNPNVGMGFGMPPQSNPLQGTPVAGPPGMTPGGLQGQIGLDQIVTNPNPNVGMGFGMPAPVSGARNLGQIIGGPAGRPITQPGAALGRPVAQPASSRPVFNQAGQPGGVIGGPQQFRGGLRPAPANYRPPVRRMR